MSAIKAIHVDPGLNVAILDAIAMEVNNLRRLDHVHIVQFVDYIETARAKNIVMELCTRDLRSLVQDDQHQGLG